MSCFSLLELEGGTKDLLDAAAAAPCAAAPLTAVIGALGGGWCESGNEVWKSLQSERCGASG